MEYALVQPPPAPTLRFLMLILAFGDVGAELLTPSLLRSH